MNFCVRRKYGEGCGFAMGEPPPHHLFLHRHGRVSVSDKPRAGRRMRFFLAVSGDHEVVAGSGQAVIHGSETRCFSFCRVRTGVVSRASATKVVSSGTLVPRSENRKCDVRTFVSAFASIE